MAKTRDEITTIIERGFYESTPSVKIASDILAIKEIAIVNRDAEWPEPHMHPPEGVLIRFMQDLREAGWVKEIKD